MKKLLLFLLLFSLAAFAANEQVFTQEVYQNGTSKISRQMDLSIFSARLGADGLSKMAQKCIGGFVPTCSVDVSKKSLYMEEFFSPDDSYYAFSSDGGFPYMTYSLTINSIPTQKFVQDTDRLLYESGALTDSAGSASSPLDLSKNNSNFISIAKLLNTNLSYSVIMPGSIDLASAGSYRGSIYASTAGFDLLSVLQTRSPIIVRSKDFNSSLFVMIIGAIALVLLGYLFFGISRKDSKPNKADLKKAKKK